MCKWGNTTNLKVNIPAHLSHTGESRWAVKPVDSCIAHIVQALNDAGILTASSCCGHGKGPGGIALQDGRELVIGNRALYEAVDKNLNQETYAATAA